MVWKAGGQSGFTKNAHNDVPDDHNLPFVQVVVIDEAFTQERLSGPV